MKRFTEGKCEKIEPCRDRTRQLHGKHDAGTIEPIQLPENGTPKRESEGKYQKTEGGSVKERHSHNIESRSDQVEVSARASLTPLFSGIGHDIPDTSTNN
jgi:hypothetical protein